ncbi:MAG: UbiA-like polyprenyltransferase, partial [Pseudomonadota bacterium]
MTAPPSAGPGASATRSPAPTGATGASHPIVVFGRMVKFTHTIFALPFALAAVAIAARGGGLALWRLGAIVVAMAGARTAAMGFNRIVDRSIDARNPRTAGRELPRGIVSLRAAWTMTLVSTGVFIAAAAVLGPLCLALTPVALLFLFGYSLTKRFTALCHLILGLAIAAGPGGAWIAIRGDFGWAPGLLMIAVGTWIGGFDVLYSLADREFDSGAGLHSILVRLGVTGALLVSALLHVVTVA